MAIRTTSTPVSPSQVPLDPGAETRPPDAAEQQAKLGRQADAKRSDAQAAGKKLDAKNAAGEQASSVAAGNKGALALDPSAFKDLVAKGSAAELLVALQGAEQAGQALPPSSEAATLETFSALKPLLGKPNGLPVPEAAFEHPELDALAGMPLALSPDATRLLTSLGAEGVSPESLPGLKGWLEDLARGDLRALSGSAANLPLSREQALTDGAARQKEMIRYIGKLQALTLKMTDAQQPLVAPHMPAAVQRVLAENLPQITAATKQFMKALQTGKNQAAAADDIVLPDEVVLAFEAAVAPTAETYLSLIGQLSAVAAQPNQLAELQSAMADLEGGLQLSPQLKAKFGKLLDDLQLTQVGGGKPKWSKASAWLLGHASRKPQGIAGPVGNSAPSPAPGAPPARPPQSGAPVNMSSTFAMTGIDFATADIGALIYYVMMQSTAQEGEMLRDQMREMQETNAKKKAMREQITKMKSEQADVEAAMREEFSYLQAQGAVHPSVTFDDYQAWRQVTWTPEGDAMVAQPMPPLPDQLVHGPNGMPEPAGARGDNRYPADPKVAAAIAEKYGIPASDVAYLQSYWTWVAENAPSELWGAMPVGADGQPLDPANAEDLELLLQLTTGMNTGKSPEDNQRRVDKFFTEKVDKDSVALPAEQEATGADSASGDAASEVPPAPRKPVTPEKFDKHVSDIRRNPDARARRLWELLNKEPFKSDPAVQEALNRLLRLCTTDGNTKAGFEETFGDFDFTDDVVNAEAMAALISACQTVAENSHAVSMLIAFAKVAEERDEGDDEIYQAINATDPDHYNYRQGLVAAKEAYATAYADWNSQYGDGSTATGDGDGGAAAENRESSSWIRESRTSATAQNDAFAKAKEARKAADKARGDLAATGLEGAQGAQTGSLDQFGVMIQKVQDKMDSLSEMGELQSMRLQLIMDRRQKMLDTLSNIMKKMSTTMDTLIQNTK